MIRYQTIAPPPTLAHYVRFGWTLESDSPYTHHSLADGCAELIFHYQGIFDEMRGDITKEKSVVSGLQGPACSHRQFSITSGFGMIGLYLYPFAINQLFGISAAALANQLPALSDLLGNEGKILEERIITAQNNNERFAILFTYLENRLRKSESLFSHVYNAVTAIIQAGGEWNIQDLSSQYCLSTRQFERKFRDCAGFTPKRYARIIRFQKAASGYGTSFRSLTELAHYCGYYDQSHFIHDFREFSGLHPKAYFSGVTAATAWRD
ncbi:MAG: helix-turn-helix transcriptional regulator [Bacteroidetes bacterium]|nr:helix-turn-helix transcriptional regulator [Bacteroidota bacterium]